MNDADRLFPKTEKELIDESLDLFFLPQRSYYLIESVLQGRVDERSLVCCNSGCSVCNDTIYKAVNWVRKQASQN